MARAIVVHGIPLVIAIGAALLLLPWIMGASAIEDGAMNGAYSIGMAALFLYPASYQLLIVAWGISRLKHWSIQRVFLQLIWVSLLLFIGAMAYAGIGLQSYLQAR